jgi:hypothetical protein
MDCHAAARLAMTMSNFPSSLTTIATIGLHGSASTWVFNVIRELMIAAHGEDHVVAGYADTLDKLPEDYAGKHLVLKSHHGSAEMDDWLRARNARLFLSIRDPRDASISMAQRFKAPLQQSARWIANDCARLERLAPLGHPVLRYEDRFFDRPEAIGILCTILKLDVPEATSAKIFARYRTEAVREFAATLATLPPERVAMVGDFTMDKVTQILSPHIGDGTTGKWRGLPEQVQTELTRFFAPFLKAFGYPV